MPKRDMPVNADEDTRFVVIMDGLTNTSDHSLKLPKDGHWHGEGAKWRFLSEKKTGVTNGYLVSKNAQSSTTKHDKIWLYKTSLDKHYEKYFYASFCETVGSELFRYALGDLAPKNRLTKIDGEAPGIVSRFLPEFLSFAKIIEGYDEREKPAFIEQIPGLHGTPKIIATNCFFNDYDGSFFNSGLFVSSDGKQKVGRIDFGTALSNMHDHTYGIGLYLFGRGKYEYRYHYARTYAPLLRSDEFRLSILNMAQINLEHIDAIVRASVQRFVNAWRDILLDGPAIKKLFSHLYGENMEMWFRCGYTEIPSVQIDFDQFNFTISDEIIAAVAERKEIFLFFAKTLACQNELCIISTGLNATSDFATATDLEQAHMLIKEAEEDSNVHKRLLLTWLTGNRLKFNRDGMLLKREVMRASLTPLETNAAGLYPVPNRPCGVLPCYIESNRILWGCVESNRVGVIAIAPPTGTQDIIIIRDHERFVIEVAKPFPNLGFDCLRRFIGKSFKGDDYQEIVACLIENNFSVYVEEPLDTAIHEAQEEHGVDLQESGGRDSHLLNAILEFSPQEIIAKRGRTTQCVWVAYLKDSEGIILNQTIKIEEKIQINKVRQFYESGCWLTLEQIKAKLKDEQDKFCQLGASHRCTIEQIDLMRSELCAFESRLGLLEQIEVSTVLYLKSLGVNVDSIAKLDPVEFNVLLREKTGEYDEKSAIQKC